MNRITGLVIALVVGGLLVGGLLIPTVQGMTATEKTFENEGYYKMVEIGEEPITIVWDHTTPDKITVDGEEVDLSNVPRNKVTTLIVTDATIIRYAPITNDTLIQVYSSSGYYGAGANAGTDMTITIDAGTITANNGTNSVSKTFTTGYYVSNDGNWIMKEDGKDAYIHKDDSIIVLAGNTAVGSVSVGVYANGTINEGLEIETVQIDSVVRNPTYGEATFNYVEVNECKDLVKLTNCQFAITLDDTTVTATYSYFLVPDKVTAELTNHMDATQIAMFGVISILGIVALVVVAANAIRNKY